MKFRPKSYLWPGTNATIWKREVSSNKAIEMLIEKGEDGVKTDGLVDSVRAEMRHLRECRILICKVGTMSNFKLG